MISILTSAGSRRVTVGSKVSVNYRGQVFVGKVLSASYSTDQYVISINHARFHQVVVTRKRHQIDTIDDVEFEDVIRDVNLLEDIVISQEMVFMQ